MKKIILTIILGIFLISMASASDQLIINCGGDDQLQIGCIGDDELNTLGDIPYRSYGFTALDEEEELPIEIEKKWYEKLGVDPKLLLGMALSLLFVLIILTCILAYKRDKEVK